MIQNFKQMIDGWTNNDLTIKETMYSSTIQSGILLNEGQDISTDAGIDDEPHQSWLKAMDMLRDALMDIMQFLAQNDTPLKRIKVCSTRVSHLFFSGYNICIRILMHAHVYCVPRRK